MLNLPVVKPLLPSLESQPLMETGSMEMVGLPASTLLVRLVARGVKPRTITRSLGVDRRAREKLERERVREGEGGGSLRRRG